MPDPSNNQFPNPPKNPGGGIVGPPKRRRGLYWSNDKTNLDVENPAPIGGPIHFPDENHTHKYTPNNTYLDNFQSAQSHNSSFGTEGDTVNPKNSIFDKTNLDLTNPDPVGGPLNFHSEGHEHKYLPQSGKGYKDTLEFKRIKGESKSEKSLTLTGLDLESTEAGPEQQEYREPWGRGGPNRKNILKNTNSDTYVTENSHVGETNYFGEDPNLQNRKTKQDYKTKLHQFLPPPEGTPEEGGETYINSITDRGNNI